MCLWSIERNRDLAATAFSGLLALAIIIRFIGGNAKKPRLKLAFPVKGIQMLDHRKESFLADLFHVLSAQIGPKLKNESCRGRVVPIEQLVPGLLLPPAASRQQVALSLRIHD